MGNFHCIPSGCAKVVYREYLPPVVRWRYEGEDWQEIEADDYAIAENDDLNSQGIYKVKIRAVYPQVIQSFGANGRCRERTIDTINDPPTQAIPEVYGPILNWRHGNVRDAFPCTANSFDNLGGEVLSGGTTIDVLCHGATRAITGLRLGRLENPEWVSVYGGGLNFLQMGFEGIEFEPLDNNVPSECKFTVYKNEQIVYEETRDICPEVEKLGCRLSDISQEIKINKIPYLSMIEVANFAKDAIQVTGVPYPVPIIRSIPSECLNIYRNEILDPLPSGNPEEPNEPTFSDFIAQICSAPDCPSPAYQVICDCEDNCESCPDDTCAVNCDGHICCYDTTTGKAIKQIAIENYCGGSN